MGAMALRNSFVLFPVEFCSFVWSFVNAPQLFSHEYYKSSIMGAGEKGEEIKEGLGGNLIDTDNSVVITRGRWKKVKEK